MFRVNKKGKPELKWRTVVVVAQFIQTVRRVTLQPKHWTQTESWASAGVCADKALRAKQTTKHFTYQVHGLKLKGRETVKNADDKQIRWHTDQMTLSSTAGPRDQCFLLWSCLFRDHSFSTEQSLLTAAFHLLLEKLNQWPPYKNNHRSPFQGSHVFTSSLTRLSSQSWTTDHGKHEHKNGVLVCIIYNNGSNMDVYKTMLNNAMCFYYFIHYVMCQQRVFLSQIIEWMNEWMNGGGKIK